MELSDKEIVELRIKCLEPYVAVASKHGIEQDTVIKKAEVAWNYAIEPLLKNSEKPPVNNQPSANDSKA